MDDISILRNDLKQKGYALIHYSDGSIHSYPYDAPWLTDEKFVDIYEKIRKNTLVDRVRCYSLYLIAAQISQTPGDVLEIGVWRGGTAGLLAQLLPKKTIYLADTFVGVVKAKTWEHYRDKAHSDTSEELVVGFLERNLEVKNFKILKGVFPEDTGSAIARKKLSLVHIDVDVYQSAKDTFNFVWENLAPGGIVIFDDYGFISACFGIYKFVNEIRNDNDKLFIHNLNGHAYIVKI